jgi:hypothetical protein
MVSRCFPAQETKEKMVRAVGVEPTTLPHHIYGLPSARAGIPRLVIFALELAGAVELLLLFWVVHFGIEIDLCDFKRLVPKPGLDFH